MKATRKAQRPRARRRAAGPGPQAEALRALARELASAADEGALAAAVGQALLALFPRHRWCLRLLDAAAGSVAVLQAHGPLRPHAEERVVLRRAAVEAAGLPARALEAGGVVLSGAAADAPLFEGSARALALPLAAAGQLHGVLNLEWPARAGGHPAGEAALLEQVAHQAALAARHLRSVTEVGYLKGFLENLIENANALIAVVNREREVIVFNRALARLTGHPRELVLGEVLAALVVAEEREKLAGLLDRSFAGEAATAVELRLALRSGGEARVSVNTSAIHGASGEVEGVMIVGQDQTLLRALQDRAEHAQKLAELGRMAAAIVHELNNPLTAVTAYAEALVHKLALTGQDPADVEKLRRIHEAGLRIQRFSRDLSAYARPPRDARELVDLQPVLRQAAQLCEPALRAAQARVELRLEPAPPVWGDRSGLTQVFVNLVTNAAHAVEPEGGVVTLELEATGDHVAARVRDDGPGMAPEVRRRAFEPFFTTKGDGKGTGLGLSIVQGIVGRHGGVIGVESAPGAGTTFTVMLPVKPA